MILITGVSGYIGSELFKHYYELNKSTIGIYNKNKPDIKCPNNLFQVDISDYNQVLAFFQQNKSGMHNVCLVNCASITYDAFAHKSDLEKWKSVIDINLTGTFNIIRKLLTLMRKQNYGRIINLSSVVAQKGAIGTTAYAASKAGLWGLTKSLAVENANKNILVNSINLGYMDSGMTDKIPKDLQMDILSRIPLNKFCSNDEVILAVDYLINTNYVTGTSIDVNGGMY